MPGPVPRRSSERTRRNKENEAGLELKKGTARGVSQWPDPNPNWLPPVEAIYMSFRNSGMADFFEDTDVMMVWLACEGVQAWYDGGKRSANQFDFIMSNLAKLGASEAERRRMRIELEQQQETISEEEATVTELAAFKQRNVFGGN